MVNETTVTAEITCQVQGEVINDMTGLGQQGCTDVARGAISQQKRVLNEAASAADATRAILQKSWAAEAS